MWFKWSLLLAFVSVCGMDVPTIRRYLHKWTKRRWHCLNGPSARVQDTRPGLVASPGVEQMETMRGGDFRG